MSLKSKIEAVIYAAEEPVTPAQLAALFAEEALAERQERLRAEAAIAAEAALAARQQPVLMVEGEGLAPVTMSADNSETAPESIAEAEPATETEPGAEGEPVPIVIERAQTGEPAQDAATAPAEPEPIDEKRAARQREREIRDEIRQIVAGLMAEYAQSDRGMEIREVAGGYRVATKPEYHDAVRAFVKSLKPPMKLSLQALETLAVIAYKQPVTAPEVSEIRGVDSSGVLGSLISRKLITTAGRKQVIGRPILYKTTKEFLLRFGLKDVNELPSMEEFEKMAGELNDMEAPGPELPFGVAPGELAEGDGAAPGEAVETNAGESGLAVEPAPFSTEDAETESANPAGAGTVAPDAVAPPLEESLPEDTETVEVAAADHAVHLDEAHEEQPAAEEIAGEKA